jgi:hypothetical protein
MKENWNIIPKYSDEFLQLVRMEQCQAIACSFCYESWQFPHSYTHEHIIIIAKEYGYSIVNEKVLCKKCKEEQRIMKKIEERYEV